MRREGRIPATMYGIGPPTSLALDAAEFDSKFHHVSESTIIELQTPSGSHDVLVKGYQVLATTGRVQHVDFLEVEAGKTVRTRLAVHLDGTPAGVKEGGVLEVHAHEIEIECLPRDLPEELRFDISHVALGETVHVSDLPSPEGVRFLTAADHVVCLIAHRTVEEVVEPDADEVAEAPEAEPVVE